MELVKDYKKYNKYIYVKEDELEKDVIKNSNLIFGVNTIYIDEKRKLTNEFKKGNTESTIPDGYILDFTFKNPKIYFVEAELGNHSIRDHIIPQLLQFYLNYDYNKDKIKDFINNYIEKNNINISRYVSKYEKRNFDHLLDEMLKNEIIVYLIIDDKTKELDKYISGLNFKIEVIEFNKYINNNDEIFEFTSVDVSNDTTKDFLSRQTKVNPDDIDTVIVSAEEEGFNNVFIKEKCWYAIKIGINMIDKLKYIVCYQKSPHKKIAYYAEISRIEKYIDPNNNYDTGKYIIYFKDEAKRLPRAIPLNSENPNKAPQGRVYTNFARIYDAPKNCTLDDIF